METIVDGSRVELVKNQSAHLNNWENMKLRVKVM